MDQRVTPPVSPSPQAALTVPEALRQWALRFALALALTLVAASMPFPARFATAPFAVVALVVVTVALWKTAGVPGAAPLRAILGLGTVAAAACALFGAAWLLYAPEVTTHERCIASAITPDAKTQCDAAYEKSVNEKFGLSSIEP